MGWWCSCFPSYVVIYDIELCKNMHGSVIFTLVFCDLVYWRCSHAMMNLHPRAEGKLEIIAVLGQTKTTRVAWQAQPSVEMAAHLVL